MKMMKNISLTALLSVALIGSVTFTSCNRDECKDVVCQNGGVCNEDDGSCTCATGYEGALCTTKSFLGSWKGNDVCGSGNYNDITIKVDPSSTDSSRVIVTNPGGFGSSVTATGTLSADARTITITGANVGGNRSLTGTMTLTSKTNFNFAYTVTPAVGVNDNCNGTYTKQ